MTKCVVCDRTVRRNQQAVNCDLCGERTHRLCFTGITKAEYLAAARKGTSLSFVCRDCTACTAENDADDQLEDDVCFFDSGSVAHSETVEYEEVELDTQSDGEDMETEVENESSSADLDLPSYPEESGDVASPLLEVDLPTTSHPNDDDTPDFEIIPNASSKSRDLLVDRVGYQYTRKPRKGSRTIYWRCVVRNSETNCKASVIEDDGEFTRGYYDHIHEPASGGALARRITSKVKDIAMANVYQSAANIAERIMGEELSDKSCPALPSVANVARAANRRRHRLRPKHPSDLDFELENEHIAEGFLQADIQIGRQRHLIFATDYMLQLLQKADTWYVDGTFKVVKAPFLQLFSIHAFVRTKEVIKQIPLCFVIMSSRRKMDYKAVFRVIREKMTQRPVVENIVSDFEKPLWKAIKKVMPDVKHRGCVFHWTQAVWRRMQSISGLVAQYKRHESAYRALREVFALPFLPVEHIAPAFSSMTAKLEELGFREVIDYVHKNWIVSKQWPPHTWSIFNQSIRTNNDVEGWHFRLNRKAERAGLNLYLLIQLLHGESKMVVVNMKLISEKKIRSTQKKKAKTNAARIQKYWSEFSRGQRTVCELLQACSYIYAPRFVEKT